MAVNEWTARGWCLVVVVMEESSSKRTEVTVTLTTSDMTRGARVATHVVFPADLTGLSCLLMFGGGRTEFSESICAGSAVVAVPSRESALMSTSSLVPRDVLQKPLMTASPALFDATVGM